MPSHFTIIIPSYNNEKWAKRCLGSALGQNYDNYDVVYINDCSTDNTAGVVNQIIEDTETSAEVKIVNNDINRKALYNLYHQIKLSKKGTIIVTLDGDDWLPNAEVLNLLNQVYDDKNVWMTAGSYIDNVM